MEFHKNDTVTLRIEDISENGEGIGRCEGYALFVRGAVIGDLAEVRITKAGKSYGYGRLMQIIEPSPDRVSAPCRHAAACGGCQLQNMSYEAQLRLKQRRVEDALIRIGGFESNEISAEPILGCGAPLHYRNKAQVPVGTAQDGTVAAGFYAVHSHRVIPLVKAGQGDTGEEAGCLLGSRHNSRILQIILDWMQEYHIIPYQEDTGKGLVRHILIREAACSGDILVCIVINGDRLPHASGLIHRLTSASPDIRSISVNFNTGRNNVILGKKTETIWGESAIEDSIGGIRFRISPQSFFQVNPAQTAILYGKALEYAGLTGQETVWDLYCGIGTISLFLAQKAGHVYGVEIVPQAVRDARQNAELNEISNVTFLEGKAEDLAPELLEKYPAPDVIVVDPPRKGCDSRLLDTILQVAPERVVYVSCNPSTLARDLKILCAGGYQIQKVQPVDQFPQTVHVETVCLLTHS